MDSLNVFKFNYRNWKYIRNIPYNIRQVFRNIKYAYQRATRGFCDYDTWNLDYFHSGLMSSALKFLAKNSCSYPYDMTPEEWTETLNKIADLFETASQDPLSLWKDRDIKTYDKIAEDIESAKNEALDLLKEYYYNLWD